MFLLALYFKSETTSIASGRLLRATEIEDLTRFDEQTGFVSINFENKSQPKNRSRDVQMPKPVTENGRQLVWPRTVLKRPTTTSTSFRNSEPATIGHTPHSQSYDRYLNTLC